MSELIQQQKFMLDSKIHLKNLLIKYYFIIAVVTFIILIFGSDPLMINALRLGDSLPNLGVLFRTWIGPVNFWIIMFALGQRISFVVKNSPKNAFPQFG